MHESQHVSNVDIQVGGGHERIGGGSGFKPCRNESVPVMRPRLRLQTPAESMETNSPFFLPAKPLQAAGINYEDGMV